MAAAVITGSAGLIGAEAARFFGGKGLEWSMRYDIDAILGEIFAAITDRALQSRVA